MKKILLLVAVLFALSPCFGQLPETVEEYAKRLKGKDDGAAEEAMTALAGHGAVALKYVVPLLDHPNKTVRARAAKTVGLIALRARKDLDEAKAKAKKASSALKECSAAFQVIAARLKDPNSDARAEAAVALGLVARGTERESAAEHLKKSLGDKNNKVRTGAAMGLAFLGKPAKVAVAELRKTLKDKNSKCRAASAKALGEIGEDARSAVSDLEAAESDKNGAVRKAASNALTKIRG